VTKSALDAYTTLEHVVAAAQQPCGTAWLWEEEYAEPRSLGALLLDLLGYLPGAETEEVLKRALTFTDPRLLCFAAVSLLRRGWEVPPQKLAGIAASAETRNMLHDQLHALNQRALFPEHFRTQPAFAEADMVNWLIFPTELGRAPDEIELMQVISADAGPPEGEIDWYLFRFRTHDTESPAESPWLAGVSGPYRRKDGPTTEAGGDTFSSFEPWDSKPPEAHVGDVRQLLRDWRRAHARGRRD
jgi:hypothetical protein